MWKIGEHMNGNNPFELSDKERAAIDRLKTVEECTQFSANMKDHSQLIQAANNRVIEIRLAAHACDSEVMKNAWSVLYAYEQVLYLKHGKHIPAHRTRKAIDRHGMIEAVEIIVSRRELEDDGFSRLIAAGMADKTFEALVMNHPQHFSEKAIRFAQDKINDRP